MILVNYKSGIEPSVYFEGTQEEVINKIHELNLCDFHDTFFYERDKLENLGLLYTDQYDYYMIYESVDEFKKIRDFYGKS